MAASAAAAEAGGWPRDELERLVQAWGEVVEPPRDREQLSAPELLRLHSRFETLCGRRGGRWLGSMERQRLRLVAAVRFIRTLSNDARSSDTPRWFKLPRTMQEQATRGDADSAAVVMAIDEDLFRAIERVLQDEPASTDATASTSVNTDAVATDSGGVVDSEVDASGSTRDPPTASTSEAPTADTSFGAGGSNIATGNDEAETRRQQDRNIEGETPGGQTKGDRESEIKAAEALAGLPIVRVSTSNPPPPSTPASRRESGRRMDANSRTNLPLRWRLCDERQLIRVWDDTLHRVVEAKLPCFALDELVLERYTDICGPNEESASSVSATRLKILDAFEFLRTYLASRSSDAPQWFEMAVTERLAEQNRNGYYDELACSLEAADFSSLSSIMENERRLAQLNPLEALVEQQRLHLEQLFELVEAEREAEWGRAQELLREIEAGRGGRR